MCNMIVLFFNLAAIVEINDYHGIAKCFAKGCPPYVGKSARNHTEMY